MNICQTVYFRKPFRSAVERMKISQLEKKALRLEFSEFIKIPNIIALNHFKTVYMSYTSEFFLSEADALTLSGLINEKFGVNIKPVCLSFSDDFFEISDFVDFNDMIMKGSNFIKSSEAKEKREYFKELEVEGNKARFDIYHSLRRPIPENINNLRVLSVDFEYDQNKNFKISECGLSTFFNGTTVHEHYLVEGNYKDKKNHELQLQFKFGKTRIVSLDTLLSIIAKKLEISDCIVGHNISAEHLILNNYGLNLLEISNLIPLDTQQIYSVKFENKTLSLAVMLDRLNIEHDCLHNAGNDAAYTLEALFKMSQCVDNIDFNIVENVASASMPTF